MGRVEPVASVEDRQAPAQPVRPMRIGVLVVAYNAIQTLGATLDRFPAGVMDKIEEIFVFDDHSTDRTYEAALEYKRRRGLGKLRIFRNERNRRYGGNQKQGYRYALERGFDVVVLLHGDGQYAPEVMQGLLDPLERDEAEMVMGSRMMPGGNPLKGGMPSYKFVGNKVLSMVENWVLGTRFFEFHSGYRAYSCRALAQVPFERCTDEWHFDTQIIIQFLARRFRIVERPIPTYYGSEICYVNGLAYAVHCAESVLRYRLHRWGWIREPLFDVTDSGRPLPAQAGTAQ